MTQIFFCQVTPAKYAFKDDTRAKIWAELSQLRFCSYFFLAASTYHPALHRWVTQIFFCMTQREKSNKREKSNDTSTIAFKGDTKAKIWAELSQLRFCRVVKAPGQQFAISKWHGLYLQLYNTGHQFESEAGKNKLWHKRILNDYLRVKILQGTKSSGLAVCFQQVGQDAKRD